MHKLSSLFADLDKTKSRDASWGAKGGTMLPFDIILSPLN